ncbi:MAG: dephospho-CoA kinase [Cytophagales bacterium]|nr:dephospho-CoA kinase [Cytophagales bacterium]
MPINPIKVGITGGIGSGKTVVCKMFNLLGVPVYDADRLAKVIMVENTEVVESIISAFGQKAYFEDGKVNRNYLASEVFGDAEKLRLLNSIVHPAVAIDFELWIKENEQKPYIVKEAALLVESGSYKTLDYLITVTSPEKVRIKRVLNRDPHRTIHDVTSIISRQLSEAEKIEKSHFVIVNDDITLIIPQVLGIHESLISSGLAG